MKQHIARMALLVHDYDQALAYYLDKLDFELIEDSKLSATKRWVLIRPPGNGECCLLLAKAADQKQRLAVGNQSGGRVFLFLFTDNFKRDYDKMVTRGVDFVRPPKEEPYGMVAVFTDLYGNLWDLIQPAKKH